MPYLLIIAMEVFSSLMDKVVAISFRMGCKVKESNREGVQISHLLLDDDTQMFCQVSHSQMTHLCWFINVV